MKTGHVGTLASLVGLILTCTPGCCYYASAEEAALICNDPGLRDILATTKSTAERDDKLRAWAEANLSSVQAKNKMEVYYATGVSYADRVNVLDDFAKEHGLDRCENIRVKGPPP